MQAQRPGGIPKRQVKAPDLKSIVSSRPILFTYVNVNFFLL